MGPWPLDIPPPPPGFEPYDPGTDIPSSGGFASIPPPPPGFVPMADPGVVGGLQILDYTNPNAPYMSRSRDPSNISRIIVHGDINPNADELIKYGQQVDPERGFDPGYHFYIDRDGTIKQGAPIDRITHHTLGENKDSIGINIAGADNGQMPTQAQNEAAKRLISQLGLQYNIDPTNVYGHGELQPNRRHSLEGGTVASDIRQAGYVPPPPPPGFEPYNPADVPVPPPPEGFAPMSQEEIAQIQGTNVGEVTAYRPGLGGIEGENVDRHGTPIVGRTTMEDYAAGKGDYVTIAMDKNSEWQGKFVTSPRFPGVVFKVVDTGSYGDGKGENWIDIAFTDPKAINSFKEENITFTPIDPAQAQKIAADRLQNVTTPPAAQPTQPGVTVAPPAPAVAAGTTPTPTAQPSASILPIVEPSMKEVEAPKEQIGFWESAKRGLMSSSLGIGETVNRYAYAPIVHGLAQTIEAIAPDTELAKKAKEFDNTFYYNTVQKPAEQRDALEPKPGEQTFAGELGTVIGQIVPDIATALLTGGASTEAQAASKTIQAAEQMVPTILNTLKAHIPGMRKAAASFSLPAAKAGMDAQKQSAAAGESPEQQAVAYMTGVLQTMGSAALPMQVESGLSTLGGRIISRTAQAVPLAAAQVEVGRGLENIGAAVLGKEQQPFDIKELLKGVIPLTLMASAGGKRARKPITVKDFSEIPTIATELQGKEPARGEVPRLKGAPEAKVVEPTALPSGGIEAFHGTPHEFTEFSMEKVGTGEGVSGLHGTTPKARAFMQWEKPAIEQDFGPEWKKAVEDYYEAHKTGRSYMTEVSGDDMFHHFASKFRDSPEWQFDTATFLKQKFDIDGIKFTKDGKQHTFNFTRKPPDPFSPEDVLRTLAVRPPSPTKPGAPPPKFGPPAIIKPPEGLGPTIRPLFRKPIVRNVVGGPQLSTGAPSSRRAHWDFHWPIDDWKRFFQGTSRIFEKSPGFEGLGKAMHFLTDRREALYGHFTNPFRKWEKSANRAEQNQALEEFERYQRENDTNKAAAQHTYNNMSPKGQELVNTWKQYATESGDLAVANNVHVLEPAGSWRPFRKVQDYFPRSLKREYVDILRRPTDNPAAYKDLLDEMQAMGYNKAQAEEMFSHALNRLSSNDYFGGLEHARTAVFPQFMYDYSFEAARRNISGFSNRMAQIESFGQKTGPATHDLFDQYHEIAGDQYTRDYIKNVQGKVYNVTADNFWPRIAANANMLAAGLQLGNPRTASRNLISGQAIMAGHYGGIRYIKSILNLKNVFDEIKDGYEKGIIRDDMMNIVADGESAGGSWIRRGATGALKWTGEIPAEVFNRGINIAASKALLRDAIKAFSKDPFSSRSRGYAGHFKRLGLDPQDLIDEQGIGPITDRYLRSSVNAIQGGYHIDQVPAFLESNAGKFFFKYRKWGTQQLQYFGEEVLAPAARALSLGKYKGETVSLRDAATGKMRDVNVPGNLMPLARYMAAMAAGGMISEELVDRYLFGLDSRSASLAEIMAQSDEGSTDAMMAAANKLMSYYMTTGFAGAAGTLAQTGLDYTQRVRYSSPLDPPAASPFIAFTDLVQGSIDQGGMPFRDIDSFLRQQWSLYRVAKQSAANVNQNVPGASAAFKSVFPEGERFLDLASRKQDLIWMSRVTKRFEADNAIQAVTRRPGSFGKTPSTAWTQDFKDALLLGDVMGARQMLRERQMGMKSEQKKTQMTTLMQSVYASQPIKAGGSASEGMRANFLQWAAKNMSTHDLARIKRIDEVYRKTAITLGVMTPKGDISEDDVSEDLRKAQIRTLLRSF